MRKEPIIWIKASILVLVSAYFFLYAFNIYRGYFLDGVNVLMHEAGHFIFMFFGRFIHVAGGTFMQLLVPLLFAFYFLFKEKYVSSSLVFLWLGQSLVDVSVYASDGLKMQLPLLGGSGGIHDWNYLLGRLGILHNADKVGLFFQLLGIVVMLLALGFGLYKVFTNKEDIYPHTTL